MAQWKNIYTHGKNGALIFMESMPVGDTSEHEEGAFCPCKPQTQIVEGIPYVIHNSFDGREAVEWAESILANA